MPKVGNTNSYNINKQKLFVVRVNFCSGISLRTAGSIHLTLKGNFKGLLLTGQKQPGTSQSVGPKDCGSDASGLSSPSPSGPLLTAVSHGD